MGKTSFAEFYKRAQQRKRKPRSAAGGWGLQQDITHYKKGFGSHCIYSTFEKASFMPEFQRSAIGLYGLTFVC